MPLTNDPLVQRAAAQPFDAATTTQTLDLTDTDDSIPLAAGVYECHHTGSGLVPMRLGSTTVGLPPASKAAAVTGWLVPGNGAVVTIVVEAAGALHARTLTGTATLYLHRKVLT